MSTSGTQPASCERNHPSANGDHADAVAPGALRAAVARAGSRLLQMQQPDGHWCGELRGDTTVESAYILPIKIRAGAGRAAGVSNYLYGTWCALHGLQAVQFDMQDDLVQRAALWLRRVQQSSGGWVETCRSYDDPALAGQGSVTASQSGWAVLALIAAGPADSAAARAGIEYLLETQQPEGNWHEEPFTGTGFPKVFYLRYPMYPPVLPVARAGPLCAQGRHRLAAAQRRLHGTRGRSAVREARPAPRRMPAAAQDLPRSCTRAILASGAGPRQPLLRGLLRARSSPPCRLRMGRQRAVHVGPSWPVAAPALPSPIVVRAPIARRWAPPCPRRTGR
jgi:hypothetical protein